MNQCQKLHLFFKAVCQNDVEMEQWQPETANYESDTESQSANTAEEELASDIDENTSEFDMHTEIDSVISINEPTRSKLPYNDAGQWTTITEEMRSYCSMHGPSACERTKTVNLLNRPVCTTKWKA